MVGVKADGMLAVLAVVLLILFDEPLELFRLLVFGGGASMVSGAIMVGSMGLGKEMGIEP